jgi:hypothetical protein
LIHSFLPNPTILNLVQFLFLPKRTKICCQNEKDSGFPFFEEDNYLGWLVHYKALLRSPDYPPGTQDALFEACPKAPFDETVDTSSSSYDTSRACSSLKRRQDEWTVKDNICFSTLMKALRTTSEPQDPADQKPRTSNAAIPDLEREANKSSGMHETDTKSPYKSQIVH